ncbi:nucleolin-like [Oryza brachyantha]|uniref:nucleolin-like n=1 Tax=Oryza brachyantha TaxID=4533 RepID=UPI001ADB0260|nr:nucleolin-like [Oryza brachyantha]
MKGGRGSNGAATDLLVCFPSRAHLALMPPKAICSPSRPSASEPVKRRHSTSRAGPPPTSTALFKAASARNPSRRGADVPVDDEPSSPKVTCAGQIKARRPAAKPKSAGAGAGAGGGKAKKATWLQALGIKKDALPFLNAVHGAFRLNVAGCFGSFPGAVEYTSGEDDDDDDEEELAGKETEHGAALAKWFMVLEEGKKVSSKKREQEPQRQEAEEEQDKEDDVAPPVNALMLMRCRSAPAKGLPRRLEGDAEEEAMTKTAKKEEDEDEDEEENKERLVLMSYAPDFFKVSVDIAKETWIVGGDDAVLRCRSWKR